MLSTVPGSLQVYLVTYTLLTLTSFGLILKKRQQFNFLTKEYFKFIFTKERFLIYVIGTLALLIPVPFLEIHSWDYFIAIFQPILAYLTAPWAIDIFCKIEKGKACFSEVYTAVCMMLFTGSWSVEIYLLLRNGYYMPDWLVNIPIGIFCYIIVGVLWQIDWNKTVTN